MNTRASFLAMATLCAVSTANAAPPCARPTALYFGNGVNTTRPDAEDAMWELPPLADEAGMGPIEPKLAYNPTDGLFLDVVQTLEQKVAEDGRFSWFLVNNILGYTLRGLAIPNVILRRYGPLVKEIQDFANDDLAKASSQPTAYYDDTVGDHVSRYRTDLMNGQRVIVVAHSQGNMYANSAYGYLKEFPGLVTSFGITSVATPAEWSLNGYVTSDNDLVMGALRILGRTVLPSNIHIPFSFSDVTGHLFTTTYINPSLPARAAVTSLLSHIDESLPFPTTSCPVQDAGAPGPGDAGDAEAGAPELPLVEFPSVSWGDPHLRTFDGVAYDMQAVGELTLVRDPQDDLEVQIRTKPYHGSNQVAVTDAVAIRVGADRVEFERNGARLNGARQGFTRSRTRLPGGGDVFSRGEDHYVVWPDGSQVHVARPGDYYSLSLYLADERSSKVSGLLGNFDHVTTNEFRLRDGTAVALPLDFQTFYHSYAESWRIAPDASLFDYAPGETTETFTDRTFPHRPALVQDLSDADHQRALAICQAAGVTNPTWLDACVLDVGITGDADFARGYASVSAPASVMAVTLGTDSDSDGVPDLTDNCPKLGNPLQDDADSNGVGDACDPDSGPNAVSWLDWTAVTNAGTASGTTAFGGDTITVNYAGEIFTSQTSGTTNYFVPAATFIGPQAGAPAPVGDFIGLVGGNTKVNTLTFSKPVRDPYIAILSLGNPGGQASYQFDAPFEILSQGGGYWGGGTLTTRNGTVLVGQEGNGVIRFKGTFSSISWTVPTAENWHGFTVGFGNAP